MKSDAVLHVQQFLKDRQFLTAPIGGYYGAATAKAVLAFQKSVGITATNANRVGPMTLAAMNAAGGEGSLSLGIPVVQALPASGITNTEATISASMSLAQAQATSPVFSYGTSLAYGTSVKAVASQSGLSARLTGLACGTTYHYTVTAQNSIGSSSGGDMTFTTLACVAS